MFEYYFLCYLVGVGHGQVIPSITHKDNIEHISSPFDEPSDDYKREAGGAALVAFFIVVTFGFLIICFISLFIFIRKRIRLSEDELSREEENQAYLELNSEEQELFFQSKEYLQTNPYIRGELTLSQNLLIQEKGIKAWEFIKDSMLTNNDLLIINKYELNFFKRFECSTQTNLPIPNKNEVYYFENKIYSLPDPENTKISLGIAVKPYPWFRLPGRHQNSLSYDSDGYRRYNQPFKFQFDAPFPQIIQGDVVGIGYRVRLGTIFFTRNGKKISELKIGGHIKNFKISDVGQIFPTIGANNLCSVHVNLGQMGFVYIEGNVKKWGFAPLEGSGPAPPAYNKFNADILLERSEIDDENDLSERENDFPPDFWEIHGQSEEPEESSNVEFNHDKFSYNAYSDLNSTDERITLNSLVAPMRPPSYEEDLEEEDQEQEDAVEDLQIRDDDIQGVGEENDGTEEEGEAENNEVSQEEVSFRDAEDATSFNIIATSSRDDLQNN